MNSSKTLRHIIVGLFCSWPVFNFILINFSENLISTEIYWVLFTLTLGGFLLSICLVEILKLRFSLYALPLAVLGFFSFGVWLDFVENTLGIEQKAAFITLSLVSLQIIVSTFVIGRLVAHRSLKFATIFGFVILFVPSITTGLFGIVNYTNKDVIVEESALAQPKSDLKTSPNIYFIVLDMYARQDVLAAEFGLDNSAFLSQLEHRDFIVDRSSFSNYPTTPLTISTSFNMDFYSYDKNYSVDLIRGKNPVVTFLTDNGYQFYFVDSGGNSQITCGGYEDVCLGSGTIEDGIALIVKMTPLWRLMHGALFSRYFEALYLLTDLELSVLQVVDQIVDSDEPAFVFAHILSPHEPARFNSDCTKIFNLNPGLGAATKEGYKTDLRCLNEQIIRSVDHILSFDKTNPIILIQSDHGIRSKEFGSDDLILDLKNLMTFKLPQECQSLHYSGMTPVNNFRMVMSCLTQTDFVPVEDKLLLWQGTGRDYFRQVDTNGKTLRVWEQIK